jgi:purine-nucleoside/S-methyl-5'-thioadenosine phosphorylase / adenosine deaminase
MKRINTKNISFLQFKNLADDTNLRHGVSLRDKAIGGESDISSRDPSRVWESRKQFCTALGLNVKHLVRHKQVHGNRIAVITKPGEAVGQADGFCTNQFDVPLLLLGADCPLILVYDPVTPAVGLAHAGWRGTVQQITMQLVATMKNEFGCQVENMLAGIGPGICGNCYIVGESVMMIAAMNLRETEGLFRPAAEQGADRERWYFDLIEANRRQLLQAGIPARNIEISGYCTYENPDLFPSYRREGTEAGRWMLLAGLKKS